MGGYTIQKHDYLLRLRRFESQARGLHRMIDCDTYCIDIITQIGSVAGALQGVALGLVGQRL
jgi:CsoR family transcriptional regulator, copper-sensing transcriptional repressor